IPRRLATILTPSKQRLPRQAGTNRRFELPSTLRSSGVNMNTKSIFAATLVSFCAVSGTAWAADTQAGADMTRDEVIAAMKDAEARGLISHGELDYPPAVTPQSNKTRQEVQAEFAAARAAGQISEGELDYP